MILGASNKGELRFWLNWWNKADPRLIPLSEGKGYVESEFVYNRLQHRTWFQGLHFSPAICPQALPWQDRVIIKLKRAGAFEKPNVAESILSSSLFLIWPCLDV